MGQWFNGGEHFPIFNVNGFIVGINICWDNNFPENASILAKQGAEILLSPHAMVGAEKGTTAEDWCNGRIAFLRGTSIFYGLHIIACNHWGEINAPDGNLL